ncbi:hypothetical protein RRG08_000713 [Elysia crispata]|uniref:Uncharacterized protein n=1 Tax=Elysia crispata TaxID=231223 RepID=A0AAE1AYV8_9GAST|nr:hypothetical protein RRG08_000713 [Elysia crispata]
MLVRLSSSLMCINKEERKVRTILTFMLMSSGRDPLIYSDPVGASRRRETGDALCTANIDLLSWEILRLHDLVKNLEARDSSFSPSNNSLPEGACLATGFRHYKVSGQNCPLRTSDRVAEGGCLTLALI